MALIEHYEEAVLISLEVYNIIDEDKFYELDESSQKNLHKIFNVLAKCLFTINKLEFAYSILEH